MKKTNKILICVIIVVAVAFALHKYHEAEMYKSFKRGCLVNGGSKELCNVESTEYVEVLH